MWDSTELPDWFSSNPNKDAQAGGNPPSARWRFPGTLPALQTPTDMADGKTWLMFPAPILFFVFGIITPPALAAVCHLAAWEL